MDELVRCVTGDGHVHGFVYFMLRYVWFLCKDEGHRKWEPWPVHYKVMDAILDNARLIILKARQLGISWLVAAYALWLVIFHSSQNVLLLSQGETEAKKLLHKCRYIYTFLPVWMQPALGKDNDSTLEFPDLHSGIYALPSTAKAGRSEGTNLVICDEWAFHPNAEENWAALQPTLGASAKFIGLSTANGRGNLFQSIWAEARNLANGFKAMFLGWREGPERDDAWYARQKQEYSATPHLLAQEHPSNEVEAFIASGNCVFEVEKIQQNLEDCKAPIKVSLNGMLKIWEHPRVGRRYVAGADVAEGIDAGNDKLDYSGAAIYDWQTGKHVADLHGQWTVDVFAGLLDTVCREYNNAFLGVERNNHGHAVLLQLKNLEYPNLYYHSELQRELTTGKQTTKRIAGWPTNRGTKPVMEGTLASLINSGGVLSYDKAFWDECLSYVRHGDGTTGAQQGCHDDRCVKHMIALQMRERMPARAGNGLVAGTFKVG